MATNEKLARRTRTRVERRGSLAARRAFGVKTAQTLVDKVEFENRKVVEADRRAKFAEKLLSQRERAVGIQAKIIAGKLARGLLSVTAVPEAVALTIFERIQGPLFRGKITREQFKSTFGTEPEA